MTDGAGAASSRYVSAVLELVGAVPGVSGLTIIDGNGQPAASAGDAEPRRDAVLTSFLATRVQAITAEGDLRGIGRQLRESRLLHASFSGRNREFLLVPAGPVTTFATVKNGAYADVVLEDMCNVLRPR